MSLPMDLDGPLPIRTLRPTQQSAPTILCCNCGTPIDGTLAAGAMCYDCIKSTVDISEGIQREATLHHCRGCERWLQPPHHWLQAAPESRELLALCLRKLRGLTKVRIIDASFIWTEPHSRRVKLKITIQSEAFESTILQQTFEVEFVVAYAQCPECAKSYTANTWRACVQVRQKVSHKRTFLFLEQLILKHGAHKDAINIKEIKDGLDFFFAQRNHAQKFVEFLTAVVPVRTKRSEELISHDIHTSTKSYKFSFSVELLPICKDDLLCLPDKLAKSMGNINQIVLCSRVGTSLTMLDPQTLQTADLSGQLYWREPFSTLADIPELIEYMIMDIEPLGKKNGRFFHAEATVARISDLGRNDQTYYTRTHLGAFLHPGDTVLGYHLVGTQFNDAGYLKLQETKPARIPDVIIVKKQFKRSKKKQGNNRSWRLRRMAREESEMKPRKQDQDRSDKDYELFLRDVEEDEELRNMLTLYKSTKKTGPTKMEGIEEEAAEKNEMEEDADDDDDEEDLPEIDVNQLLEDMEDMSMGDGEEV